MGKPAVAIPVGHCPSQGATSPFQAWLLQCMLGILHRGEDRQDEDVWSSALSARTISGTQTLQIFKAESREKGKRKENIWRFFSIVLWNFQSSTGV